MITIVDYGVGNIASLINMYDYLGYSAVAGSSPEAILSASRLVLPGVGAFDHAMRILNERDLAPAVREAARRGTPLLGVCLGMQLLGAESEEGVEAGLGLVSAVSRRIQTDSQRSLKVPHIGWANVRPTGNSALFPKDREGGRFYFVHSYYMECEHVSDVAAMITYGRDITVAISHENIHGVQFHPEKSHRFGMRVLKDFLSV